MTTPDTRPDPRFWKQLELVNEALPEGASAAAGPEGAGPGSAVAPRFAYLAGHILVRAPDVSRAIEIVERAEPEEGDVHVSWPSVDGQERVATRRLALGRRNVFRALEALEREKVHATLVHLVSVSGVNLCPGDEPVPASAPVTPPSGPRAHGANVTVTVMDTGLVHDYLAHAWLDASTGTPNIPMVDGDVTTPAEELEQDGTIKPYTGHGTFIAGVVRRVAPATDVRVYNTFPYAGAVPEDELGLAILQTLDAHGWPDIISLSAGASTDRAQALLGLADFVTELVAHPGTVLVAAAGNDGVTDPFWPAALAGEPVNTGGDVVVSVGALREDGQGRACFSNHGSWVKVYAPGERLVNAYTSGDYLYDYPASTACRHHSPALYPGCTCVAPFSDGDKETFTGLARWSGTSFATPIIAAVIAARVSQAQVTSRQAAKDLVDGLLAVPDLSGLVQ
ncbi:S8/S53 family peptidase [Nonomuraea sp. NPDC048916]|uniref:S8/S53 family peptidase n=1 Tax=Nonomuraea sp. NPDC048916 TaxID=3154232 RepID=UPI0033FC0912